jgi:hypothetical protein
MGKGFVQEGWWDTLLKDAQAEMAAAEMAGNRECPLMNRGISFSQNFRLLKCRYETRRSKLCRAG